METAPTYQGNTHAASNIPMPQISPGTPELDNLMGRNRTAMLGSAIELDEELVHANDFAVQQERINRTKDITEAYEAEMKDIAARPYGDPQSLFDKNGNFRQGFFNERKNYYLSLLKGMDGGFLGAEAKAKAATSLNDTKDAMAKFAISIAKASLKQHGVQTFSTNFYKAIANRQFNVAGDLLQQAIKANVLSKPEARHIGKRAYVSNAKRKASTPQGMGNVWESLCTE